MEPMAGYSSALFSTNGPVSDELDDSEGEGSSGEQEMSMFADGLGLGEVTLSSSVGSSSSEGGLSAASASSSSSVFSGGGGYAMGGGGGGGYARSGGGYAMGAAAGSRPMNAAQMAWQRPSSGQWRQPGEGGLPPPPPASMPPPGARKGPQRAGWPAAGGGAARPAAAIAAAQPPSQHGHRQREAGEAQRRQFQLQFQGGRPVGALPTAIPAAPARQSGVGPPETQPDPQRLNPLEFEWTQWFALLLDPRFAPGDRVSSVAGTSELGFGLLFKEHPKRRRVCARKTEPIDRWTNSGGQKGSLEHTDAERGMGIRKRYGKIMRDGSPQLRYHEYNLMTQKSGESGSVVWVDEKTGPVVFHVFCEESQVVKPEWVARSEQIATQAALARKPQLAAVAVEPHSSVCHRRTAALGVPCEAPVAWSPDGQLIAVATPDSSVVILHVNGANAMLRLEQPTVLRGFLQPVTALVFHPTLPLLAGGAAAGMTLWDSRSGGAMASFGDTHALSLLWIHPRLLASAGSNGVIKMWELHKNGRSLRIQHVLEAMKSTVLNMAFSTATMHLAVVGVNGNVKIFDCSVLAQLADDMASLKGKNIPLLGTLEGHRGDVLSLAWSPTGRTLITGGRDNQIIIWNCKSGKKLRQLTEHRGDVTKLTLFNKGQYMYSGSADGTVKLWKLAPEPADGATAAAAGGGMDVADAEDTLECSFPMDASGIARIEICGKYLAQSSYQPRVNIWDISNLAAPVQVQALVGQVKMTAVLQVDDQVIGAGGDSFIRVYDRDGNSPIANFEFGGMARCLQLTPNRQILLAAGTEYSIKGFPMPSLAGSLPSTAPTSPVVEYMGHCGKVNSISVAMSGTYMASAGHDFDMLLWMLDESSSQSMDTDEQSPVARVACHGGHVTSVSFGTDARTANMLATSGADHSLMIWKIEKRRMRSGLSVDKLWQKDEAHDHVISQVCWGLGPHATRLFTASWDKTIKVWEIEGAGACRELATLQGHTATVMALAVVPDGNSLISASWDGTLRMWDLRELRCICTYSRGAEFRSAGTEQFTSVTASSTHVMASTESGMVYVYPLCNDAGRAAIGAEADDYFKTSAPTVPMMVVPVAVPVAVLGGAPLSADASQAPMMLRLELDEDSPRYQDPQAVLTGQPLGSVDDPDTVLRIRQEAASRIKRTRWRRSAPEMASMGIATTDAKRSYHNKSERDRTQRVNQSVVELRQLTGCSGNNKLTVIDATVATIEAHVDEMEEAKRSAAADAFGLPLGFQTLLLPVASVSLALDNFACNAPFVDDLGLERDELPPTFLALVHNGDWIALRDMQQTLIERASASGAPCTQVVKVRMLTSAGKSERGLRASLVLEGGRPSRFMVWLQRV